MAPASAIVVSDSTRSWRRRDAQVGAGGDAKAPPTAKPSIWAITEFSRGRSGTCAGHAHSAGRPPPTGRYLAWTATHTVGQLQPLTHLDHRPLQTGSVVQDLPLNDSSRRNRTLTLRRGGGPLRLRTGLSATAEWAALLQPAWGSIGDCFRRPWTGATDPLLPATDFQSTGRSTLKADIVQRPPAAKKSRKLPFDEA